MSTVEQQQVKEIEIILREIYAKYQDFDINTIYYKLRGKDINRIELKRDTYYANADYLKYSHYSDSYQYLRKLLLDDILSNPDLEYALYVNGAYVVDPSWYCIKLKWPHGYLHIISQFFPELPIQLSKLLDVIPTLYNLIVDTLKTEDPLTQILRHRNGQLKYALHKMYDCENVTLIKPYICEECKKYSGELRDPTSIFHGRRGIIAYCASLRNILYADIFEKRPFELLISIEGLSHTVPVDLNNLLINHIELKELREKDPIKGCSVELLLKYMWSDIEKNESLKKKIEEFNSRLRRYGFIRVAFPLD